MRDLKRVNALRPAHIELTEAGFEVFTPKAWKIIQRGKKKSRELQPIVHDLLFVRSLRETLDPVVERTPTLQYRFLKGGRYCEPMTVREAEMKRFIAAVEGSDEPRFYLSGELTPDMIGRRIRILQAGPLNGFEGNLLALRGSRKKRVLVDLPGILSAAVEIQPEFIEFI